MGHPAENRLKPAEIKKRVEKAYDLRYNKGYGQLDYVKWAKKNYGDKSEKTYCRYFLQARHLYEERWKEILEQQLSPAVDEIKKLLEDKDPKIRQKAIDQIFKYTGNDIQKVDAKVDSKVVSINVDFGNNE